MIYFESRKFDTRREIATRIYAIIFLAFVLFLKTATIATV